MIPAEQRLRNNRDFRAVYAKGRSRVGPLAVLYVWKRPADAPAPTSGRRIGFVVSKKQGGAIERNRIKRRMREAVRLRLSDLKDGPYDLIFVARSGLKTAEWPQIQAALAELLRQSGMLANKPAVAERAAPNETANARDNRDRENGLTENARQWNQQAKRRRRNRNSRRNVRNFG